MEDVFCSPKVGGLLQTALQKMFALQEIERLMIESLIEFESLTIDGTFRMLYSLQGQSLRAVEAHHTASRRVRSDQAFPDEEAWHALITVRGSTGT
eukprot:1700018-Amphidinium_carterae.1